MTTEIVTTYTGGVCYLTLHPPAGKPPTLDHAVIAAMEDSFSEIRARAHELIAVVVQSTSPKFFCAGANLNVMAGIDGESIRPWVHRGHRTMNQVEDLPLPVVARVEGYAMGGGLELAMACDLILASTKARFAQSEARLGLVTGWGGSYRLVRRVGLSRAKELCFTGRMVEAVEAVAMGLADWCGEPEQLELHLTHVLDEIGRNSRAAVREMKGILATCVHGTLEENAAIEAEASRRCLTEGDARERVHEFLQSRLQRTEMRAATSPTESAAPRP